MRETHLRARLRAWPPLRLDGALGALVFLEALLEVALVDASLPSRAAVIIPAGLMAAALTLRRRDPVLAMGLASAGIAGETLGAATVSDASSVMSTDTNPRRRANLRRRSRRSTRWIAMVDSQAGKARGSASRRIPSKARMNASCTTSSTSASGPSRR